MPQIDFATIGTSERSMPLDASWSIGSLILKDQQLTVCKWVGGAYEDRVFKGSDRVESEIVQAFALTVEQLFG